MMISADKIKQAVKEEFDYRAKQGRVNYSYEEIVQIVVEVIDEVDFEYGVACPSTRRTWNKESKSR